MYKKSKRTQTSIQVNKSYQGESIEQKINRIVNNKEPIKDGAPIIYTERKDGVKPEYDIRTDRFEIAIDAMDAVSKTYKAKRENSIKEREDKKKAKTLGEQAKENMQKEGGGPEGAVNTND